jgi:4-hydroxy-tetrahydrodipicolinate synthase
LADWVKKGGNMFKGTIVALTTPFNEQNQVDYQTVQRLLEWHIESGTDAIVLCGSTGEAPTLSDEEQISIFQEGVRICKGKVSVIAGTGSYDTHHCVEMTHAAKTMGVDAALVVVPYYNRPTFEGCFRHFQAVSHVGLPMIVYHHPGRTGIKLPINTLLRIADLPHVVAIKDSTADLDYAIELIQQSPIPVLTGDDTLTLAMMAVGGVGVISVIANLIPKEWKQLTSFLLNDQWKEARGLFRQFFPLVKSMLLEINPQCVKYGLSLLGKCSSQMRLPLIEPQESTQHQIRNELIKAGLLTTEIPNPYCVSS